MTRTYPVSLTHAVDRIAQAGDPNTEPLDLLELARHHLRLDAPGHRAIAQALLANPALPLLVLFDPQVGLEVQARSRVAIAAEQLRQRGRGLPPFNTPRRDAGMAFAEAMSGYADLLEALERHHASGLVDYVTLYVAHPDARTFGPKVTALASA